MSDAIDIAPCCANCRYSVMQDPVMGTCNRYAPRPVTSAEWPEATWWPPVEANHWCGEWALPPTDDELFADYLARSAGIPKDCANQRQAGSVGALSMSQRIHGVMAQA